MVTQSVLPRYNSNTTNGVVTKHKDSSIFPAGYYKPNILGLAFSACVESARSGLISVVASTKQAWCALGMWKGQSTNNDERQSDEGGSSCCSRMTLVGVGLMSGAIVSEPEAMAMGVLQSSLKAALANSQLVHEGRYREFGGVVVESTVVGGMKEAVKEAVYDSICGAVEVLGGELLAEVVAPGLDALIMASNILRRLPSQNEEVNPSSSSALTVRADVPCARRKKNAQESKRAKEVAQRTCVSIISKGTGIAVCVIAGPAGGVVAATMAKYFLPKFF